MVYKLRSMYVSLFFYSPTTVNYSSKGPLMFISCYFVHERKKLQSSVEKKTCRKKLQKPTVSENPNRKKSKVGLKNTQTSKTLTFVGHSNPYYEL